MDTSKATLESCETSGCGWACCNYGKDGHIILLPNELENADAKTDHLLVIDNNYNGGKKVKCTAANTANCDGGYKPVQCGVYPLWVKSEEEILRSMKCPLSDIKVAQHKKEAQEIISDYKRKNPELDLDSFLSKAEVDRYGNI